MRRCASLKTFLNTSEAVSNTTDPTIGPRTVPAPPSMATMAISFDTSSAST